MDQVRAARFASLHPGIPGNLGNPRTTAAGRIAAFVGALLVALAMAGATPAAAETLLVLGVARDGKADLRLSRQISDRLARTGETVAPATRLTAKERLCVAQDCLEALAGREAATVVLTASVQPAGRGTQSMAALLYDVVRRKPYEVAGECERCMPETLALRVGDLFERLLKQQREQRGEPLAQRRSPAPSVGAPVPVKGPEAMPAPGPAPAQLQAVTSRGPAAPQILHPPRLVAVPAAEDDEVPRGIETASPRRPFGSLTPTRKRVAGVLGGVAAATLITAISLHAASGQPTGMDCEAAPGAAKFCVSDYRGLYGTGYALAGLSLIGVGVSLFLPGGEAPKRLAQRD